MKKISEIREINKYKGAGDISFESFMKQNAVNENTITNEMMDWYAKMTWDKSTPIYSCANICHGTYRNPYHEVNEMLKSMDANVLVKELSKSLECGVKIDPDAGFSDKKDAAKQLLVPYNKFNLEKVEDTCEKMYWDLTLVYCEIKGEGKFVAPSMLNEYPICRYREKYTIICVEPKNTPNKTDYVKNKCKGILYHLCAIQKFDNIMKSGLRPKGSKNSYRFFDNKIYMFTGKDKNEIKHNAKIVFDSLVRNKTDKSFEANFKLLKIDASKYNIDFYQDTFYNEEGIVFTYAYFPPSMIEEISFKEVGL